MKVDIEVERAAEALDQRHRTAVRVGPVDTRRTRAITGKREQVAPTHGHTPCLHLTPSHRIVPAAPKSVTAIPLCQKLTFRTLPISDNQRRAETSDEILVANLVWALSCCLFWLALVSPAVLAVTTDDSYRDQHPLELLALKQPDAVLKALPKAYEEAESAGDFRELSRLGLAQANACRVQADWDCQQNAAMLASSAAETAKDQYLEVRAQII